MLLIELGRTLGSLTTKAMLSLYLDEGGRHALVAMFLQVPRRGTDDGSKKVRMVALRNNSEYSY